MSAPRRTDRRRATRTRGSIARLTTAVAVSLALATPAWPQGGAAKTFSNEEIEQLVAPIALYPDALVAQVLMASTYPLEVVEAMRWVKANPKVKGDALEAAMQGQTWDPSVKSLVAFPQVLQMMDEKIDWTTKLGDAFLAQQSNVMNAIQRLRARAQAAGNLTSNDKQEVIVQQAPPAPADDVAAQASAPTQTIIIQPTNPEVVYVPTYNPTVVYGAWPYPAYPPYYYYPPGYTAMSSIISFGVGMAVGSALWGGCNWGGGDVDINVNRYNSYNRTDISNNKWSHDVSHRKGVQYRDQNVRDKYNKGDLSRNAQSREAFRGRAEQGRQEIASGGADSLRARGDDKPGQARGQIGDGQRGRGGSDRPASAERGAGDQQRRQASAFNGMGEGSQVRRDSARGSQSRQQAAAWDGGNRGGGGRGGGGGRPSAGGGGRGGGGGRRR